MNWIFGNNINTDLITPGRYNITTDQKELAKIAFIEYLPEFVKKVQKGDFIVAGSNFGCGSSRETAPIALQANGIKAIIARSFARIFYRNALNQGLLVIAADTTDIHENDKLEIDFEKELIVNKTKNKKIKAVIPTLMVKLHKEGGIVPYLNKNGLNDYLILPKEASHRRHI